GPPGTGKTILAAATSNALRKGGEVETPAMFFNVKVSGVMSKFFGESSKIVSEIYGAARDNSPSVIFLDEFESLSGKRDNDDQSGAERRILSTILSELDGLSEKGRSDIFVLTIAATNRPWDIDEAVLSRFEKRILIPLPDPDTRKAILEILFMKRGFETTANLSDIVELCEGYSGREIERLCKEVTTRMIRDQNKDLPAVVDSGLHQARNFEVRVRPLSIDDWKAAAAGIAPGTSPEEMRRYLQWNDAVDA
ncbi:MAG: ATP-binding protein, partial [Planctomycetes bacterium]|nr:ATP-binding protein [Planctomycetota bacterium]